jgi:hypothetical protein
VSTTGGAQPRWCCDGRKLFYIALDGRLMEATLDLTATGAARIVSTVPRFMTNIGPADGGLAGDQFMVAQDGQHFLMNEIVDEPNQPPITLILNWRPR